MTVDPYLCHSFDMLLDSFWKSLGLKRQWIVVVHKDRAGHNRIVLPMPAQCDVERTISFCRFCTVSSMASMAVESDQVARRGISKGEGTTIWNGQGFEIGCRLFASGENEPGKEVRIEGSSRRWDVGHRI
jgi:hypothetical protein